MLEWPAYARAALAGLQVAVEPSLHRTPFSDGHIQQKQIYTQAKHTMAVSIPMTQAHKEAFQTWVKDDLNNGSLEFDFVPYDSDTSIKAQIVGGNVNYTLTSRTAALPWTANLTLEWWA